MVVAFVGFVGAWTKALFGADTLLWAGVAGALVATFFTFLPSFVFIFVGAPFIETTHGNLKFTAPLTGITAAVVGVIVNLALFFAYHVLWPRGFDDAFEWLPALIGAAALVALFRFKTGVIAVIGACALAGLAITLLR
jgi:chromate transporter